MQADGRLSGRCDVPTLKLDVDSEAYARLIDRAATERRPIPWQAEVELRRALGLPFPVQAVGGGEDDPPVPSTAGQSK
jgi:hypothetical protein